MQSKGEGKREWEGAFASLTTIVAILALARNFLPQEWVRAVRRACFKLTDFFNPYVLYNIQEFSSDSSAVEQLYEKAKRYLSGRGTSAAHRVTVNQPKNAAVPIFSLGDNEACIDVYQGAQFQWTHTTTQRSTTTVSYENVPNDDKHAFHLRVHRKHAPLVQQYLSYVTQAANEDEKRNRQILVYTNTGTEGPRRAKRMWESQPFTHPATFDTIALDSAVKRRILQKLDSFASDADFYRSTGRPHKFGTFLFGPPGTGKTSVIAAIANYMHYSVYDLDLTGVNSNLDLRALLTQISDRAVVIVEDIDTVELPSRVPPPEDKPQEQQQFGRMGRGRAGNDEAAKSKLTLGGLLNFADGIRSSCGSERIFVFTSNHPEKLDPALIRPGRMDLHIELSYCSYEVFTSLCRSYLSVTEHPLLDEIRKVLIPSKQISPADVTAVFDANRHSPDIALETILHRCA